MATLTVTRHDDVTVVRLSGGLTFEGVVPVTKAFESATQSGSVLIDLSDVPMVSTPGLSLLLSALKRLNHTGGKLVLVGMTRHVQDVLRRCRLDRIFTIAPDEATGLSLVARTPRTVTASVSS